MALRFTDGCDSYSATADLLKKWAHNSNSTNITFQPTGGRFGGGAIQLATSGYIQSQILRTTYDASGTMKFHIGFSFHCNDTPSSESTLAFIQDSANSFGNLNGAQNAAIRLTSAGLIAVAAWACNLASTSDIYSTTNVCDNNWHWIEILIHHTAQNTGSLQIRVDGVLESEKTSWSSWTTGGRNVWDRVSFLGMTSCTYKIDDIIIYDDLAGTLTGDLSNSNYPLGDTKIETLRPNGAGTTTQLTASAGANYTCVDESGASNDETDYVQSATDGHIDLYAFGNLASTPVAIHAINVNAVARNTDVGSIYLKGRTLSGGDAAVGPSVLLGPSYKTKQWAIPRDPDTAAAWAGAAVDAAEFGISVSSS